MVEVLTSVISQMENPCAINYSCFEYGAFENATLYVPQGTISKYNYYCPLNFRH